MSEHPNSNLALLKAAVDFPSIRLSARQLCDLELLAVGAFAPLNTYMTKAQYESVRDEMRLITPQQSEEGHTSSIFPMPICLDIPSEIADSLDYGKKLALRSADNTLLAVLTVTESWLADKKLEAFKVLGSEDPIHPWAQYLHTRTHDYYVTGSLEVLELPQRRSFPDFRRTPAETKALFAKLGWERIVGFQTRNPMHRAHY